eukprot:238377-Pyramimonas_sp.AAC.1
MSRTPGKKYRRRRTSWIRSSRMLRRRCRKHGVNSWPCSKRPRKPSPRASAQTAAGPYLRWT